MPDDPLSSPSVGSGEAPGAPGASSTQNGGGITHITPQDLTRAVQEATGPLLERLEQLQQENRQLAQQRSESAPTTPQGDFLERFANDPEGAIKEIASAQDKEIAPALAQLYTTVHDSILANEQILVDQRYGDGTWDEMFQKPLKEIFTHAQQVNPTIIANRDWVRGEVAKLRGFHEDALQERRLKAAEAAEKQRSKGMDEIARHAVNRFNISGGTPTMGGRDDEPSEALKEYVALRKEKSGVALDPKELHSSLSFKGATTREGWRKAHGRDPVTGVPLQGGSQ